MCKFLDGLFEDAFIWGRAPAVNYTVKVGYNWLLSHGGDQSNDHSHWSWVWRLRLPENIEQFIWIILHGKLPTNQLRHYRHLSGDQSCVRCGAIS